MATSREERMQQRMRGAQRHQVEDTSFNFFLPEAEPEPDTADTEPPATSSSPRPATEPRATPNTSAKRRRLNEVDKGPASQSTPKQDRRSGKRQTSSDAPGSAAALIAGHVVDQRQEEVGESPADAPGSGQRRSVAMSAVARRTAALHEAVSGTSLSGGGGSSQHAQQTMISLGSDIQLQVPTSSPPPPQRLSSDADNFDELSPELSTEVPSSSVVGGSAATGLPAQGKTAGSLFAKLAHARTSGATLASEAVDELSSPSFVGIDAGLEATTTSVIPSSPLARKSAARARGERTARQSGSSEARRSTLSSLGSRLSRTSHISPVAAAPAGEQEQDELSPEQSAVMLLTGGTSQTRKASEVPSSSPANPPSKSSSPAQQAKRRRGRPKKADSSAIETVEEAEEEGEEAEEIGAAEAARAIGRKRPRRSAVHEPSPDLGSDLNAAEPTAAKAAETVAVDIDARPAKRRRRRHLEEQSPSTQNQPHPPKPRGKDPAPAPAPAPPKQKKPRRPKKSRQDADDDEQAEEGDADGKGRSGRGAPVPITVQRFTRLRRRRTTAEDDPDGDAAADEFPFANHSGVSAVDVLAQMCEDIVEQTQQKLLDQATAAREEARNDGVDHRDTLKDAQARHRALDFFQAELRTRLLEQAAALDALHALRKRVRVAHKEKLALRDEILRIRAEREQVALRMDALRTRHQAETDKAMKHANISTAMHDIDLAVEQGRAAPELTAAQQKTAEIGNLELAVSRMAEQVCGGGGDGKHGRGTLAQIRDFNAFLERTAAVLEGRAAVVSA